jgi:Protein of unknown function (DUF1553)/Protein of unknown function (DUF1549)/Planctomycete cytochrome C
MNSNGLHFLSLICLIGCLGEGGSTRARAAERPIDFNRDIRPILSDHCYACHGPDQKQRKAKLRLDTREGAFSRKDDKTIIVPGKREASELYRRITTSDADDHMPPAEANKPLNARQIGLLGRWIDEGAPWKGHWAFIKPERPPLPEVKKKDWPKNDLDYFILERLEQEGLEPSPEAGKETLIRRASFDLTGLPPSIEEVDAFLADSSPDAYNKLVDRLLDSPRYGERMTMHWLDLARYADTHGYHLDAGREMWKWRDWVIDAFNRNMPFDQFTVEQLAGDLLPNATLSQKVATGFNRNSMINFEGGAIPEEYLTHYIIDRVNTTSTVFLGLTLGCAQCHDHKFDPISRKDFYRFYAYFNAVPENGLDGSKGNAAPLLRVPSSEEETRLKEMQAAIDQAQKQFEEAAPKWDRAQAEWEQSAARNQAGRWQILEPLLARSTGGATLAVQADNSFLAGGLNPDHDVHEISARTDLTGIRAVRVEALPDDSLPGKGPGRNSNASFVLSEVELEAVSIRHPNQTNRVSFAKAEADYSQKGYEVARLIDGRENTGWAIDAPERHAPGSAWLICAEPFGFEGGTELHFRLRYQTINGHSLGRTRLAISRDPKAGQPGQELPSNFLALLNLPPDQRTAEQKSSLQTYYREKVAPDYATLRDAVADLKRQRDKIQKSIPTVMVMAQMDKPRDTFILTRGQYNMHEDKVQPGVPAKLTPPLPETAPPNRLSLARWLTDPDQPLTARVTVNRFWAMVFGIGIVKTANDFGSQGEWPSHPDLLDWLATEFVQSGWNVKHMMRLMVTSATYRQTSRVTPELLEKDPYNRLYARGPRFRLSAEEIRDNALAVSGLLQGDFGGPSVYPYQPPGLWQELSQRKDSGNWTAQKFVQSHGGDLYRRSMYTFWKRTCPPPSLQTFDAPTRETCVVQRARTCTPLQSLVLLNDPTYVETARVLAKRMMTEGGVSPEERIRYAFRLATARLPSADEEEVLTQLYRQQKERFQKAPADAEKMMDVGEYPCDRNLDPIDHAAWTSVATIILNLDETINKG